MGYKSHKRKQGLHCPIVCYLTTRTNLLYSDDFLKES